MVENFFYEVNILSLYYEVNIMYKFWYGFFIVKKS